MLDVAIIGCGVVGAAAAYELSKYQLDIVVLEKGNDVGQGTTKANSAIIHAGYDPRPGTLMARLNVEGAALAREICQKLDILYRPCGSLVLALTPAELPVLQMLYRRGLQNGVPGLRLLERAELLALEPQANPAACGALLAESAAIVCPWEFCLAMIETAIRNGVQLELNSEVQDIARIENGYRIQTNGRAYEAHYVLNAAGVWADTIHNMVAAPSYRIFANRGQYYLLDTCEGERISHVLFQCPDANGKGVLLAPTVYGNLIVGPNAEPAARDDTATTAAGLDDVAKRAQLSVPTVDLSQSIRNFAGLRAVSDRDDFIIEEAADAPGFFDLAGIKSPGLSAAPAIAKMAASLLAKAGATILPRPNHIDSRRHLRPLMLTLEERQALIEKDPSYGHIICRCEGISEGEILAALAGPVPPTTLDGVKRRCGAGTGRCQGGFCGRLVLHILAREWGCQPTDIYQERVGSYILTGKTKEDEPHANPL